MKVSDDPAQISDAEDPDASKKSERDGQHYCYRCATPWPDDWIVCENCGGTDRAHETARPTIATRGDIKTYDGPWGMLPWPKGGTVCCFGGPGSGKSSNAALIRPGCWISREQQPKPVGNMFRRVTPEHIPPIFALEKKDGPAKVRRILEQTSHGPVVIDSLTAFGLHEALDVAVTLDEWCKTHDQRGLAIIQVNAAGQAHGFMEILHLFDAVVNLSPDPLGIRRFTVAKSRWCPEGATYWSFDDRGQINIPTFDAAYSVEGLPGNYYLHPFPMKGAKWNGPLDALASIDALHTRVACAAITAPYMPYGFLPPMDHIERRRFAQRNGLQWLDPQTVQTLIEETEDNEQE